MEGSREYDSCQQKDVEVDSDEGMEELKLYFMSGQAIRLAGTRPDSCATNGARGKDSSSVTSPHTINVESTSPVTENHDKKGYVKLYNDKNFIMTNVDNNCDTKYINKNDTNNHNAHNLHK